MAYAQPRSCNDALEHGATEGGERQIFPNRGGVISSPSNKVETAMPMRETTRYRAGCC